MPAQQGPRIGVAGPAGIDENRIGQHCAQLEITISGRGDQIAQHSKPLVNGRFVIKLSEDNHAVEELEIAAVLVTAVC